MIMIGKMVKGLLLRLFAVVHRDRSPKVVFYHDVGKLYTPMGTDAKVFWEHMAYLRSGDVVCFDDGFRGIWDEREAMQKICSKVKVVVNIAVGLIGRNQYLTWEEIRELQDKYQIEFQCHTWSHQTLAGPYNTEVVEPPDGRTDSWYHHELVESKQEIEHRLGKRVTALCFPVGYFSDDVIRRCREAGYKRVYASYPGNVTTDYIQPRCLVQDLPPLVLKSVINGGMNILAERYRKRHYIG